jgi:NAD(P)-dependent dehydrogenase (short-subunit alcohol dehydrogenase family)
MKMKDQIVLVTGANRGLGEALVQASLAAGAKRVYAAARDPKSLDRAVAKGEGRVVAVALDVTDAKSIAAAAAAAPDVSVLINNAGTLSSYGVLATTDADLARDFAVNTFGLLATSKAFAPALERAAAATKSGAPSAALVNVLSIVSLMNLPSLGGYSASKAAAHSITQALRHELGKKRIAVHAILAGSIDTDMVRHIEMPKTSADDVARGILRGVEDGVEDVFPEAGSQGMYAVWKRDPKELEHQLATMSG